MQNRIVSLVICAALLALPVLAQSAQLPAPSPIEKELAARASDVTEVTLDKNMLAFAAKFMTGKNGDDASLQHLVEGLDGIYVRTYEFDKEGEFSAEQVEQLRKHFETSEWSSLVKERDIKTGETTDVMVKLVNGQTHGMFILTVEPKELTIVMILGSIHMEDLGKLKGLSGLGSLGEVEKNTKGKNKKDGDQ
jgi:hypothetical protein